MLAEFYKDCEIFLTGGSGVVGTAAVEKLLRSSDVKRIYILLRCKRGESVEQRLEKIKNARIFRVLKTEKPDALNKLEAIPGDVLLPNLGITPHYAKVLQNVSIFFHCAATVRFNEALRVALQLNVGGTWEALKFAETLRNLKMYVHVSTFFSNPYLQYVESKLYPAPMNWKLCLQMVNDESQDELFDTLTRKITVGFPNTYCFTKNLAEQVVNDYLGRLPVVIFRPSLVVSATTEPEPGFPASLTGAMGLFVLTGAGVLKTVNVHPDVHLDMTPLDYGTIVMLVSVYLADMQYKSGNKITQVPVTMSSSCGILPYTFREVALAPQEKRIWHNLAFNKNFLIPGCYFVKCKYLYNMLNFTHQIFPALLVDGILKLCGQQPVLMSLVRKAYTSLEVMRPFLFNNFKSDMVKKFSAIIEVTEGTDFNLSGALKSVESDEEVLKYLAHMATKIREVLLKEDPSTLPRARKILKFKIVLYNVIRACLLYYFLRWLYRFLLNYFSM